jgi:rhomboid protease GluP
MPTFLLIAFNVIMYLYTALLSQNLFKIDPLVIYQYGQENSLVLQGSYWQLLTAMFVHVSIIHLVGNMLFLLIFGLRAEEMFDISEYLLIYFLSGLGGNLLTLVPTLLWDMPILSAGASGAIFGMFGAVTVYVCSRLGQSIASALVYAFFLLMLSIGFGVNIFAHVGGLAVGLLIGYSLGVTRKARTVQSYDYRVYRG